MDPLSTFSFIASFAVIGVLIYVGIKTIQKDKKSQIK